MDEHEIRSRLSQISTRWSLLREAHGEARDSVQRAQAALFERYQGAAYRYLAAILRSADAADEVFQEFAVRFLRGQFRGATPDKGRFRQYLKTSLSRLATDHHRKRQRSAVPVADPAGNAGYLEAGEPEAAAFEECWRTELLENTWKALAEAQRESGSPYYAALRLYSENPAARSREIAARLNEELQPERPFTEAGIRQTVHRARKQFAGLLIDEVAASISSDDLDEVEEELGALQLLGYCRSTLADRRK